MLNQIPRLVWRSATLLLLIIVGWLSLQPNVGGILLFKGQDKVFHACAYAAFYLFAWLGWPGTLFRWRLYLGLLLYGAAIEWLQSLTGYRSAELLDMLANLTGLLLGTLIVKGAIKTRVIYAH